jgi:hypothetical protein
LDLAQFHSRDTSDLQTAASVPEGSKLKLIPIFSATMPSWFAGPIVAALGVCLFGLLTAPAKADSKQVREFIEARGCAIGPTTVNEAVAKNIDRLSVERYVASVRSDPRTVKTRDWLVLPTELCALKPPMILSEIKIDDPEVTQNLSVVEPDTINREKRCWLDGQELMRAVQVSRKWDQDKAMKQYLRFLGAGLVAGDLSFYSPDPLSTPPGFISTVGACADRSQVAEIRQSHALLIQYFGDIIRADAAGEATCEPNNAPSYKIVEVIQKVIGRAPLNAWMFFEIKLIAMGADWYDGVTYSNKGRPVPPMCQYR